MNCPSSANPIQKRKPISRVTRTKEEAKASYDKMSGWYDVLAGSSERKHKEAGLLKLNVQNGEKVLEIGYGTGECLIELARSVGIFGKIYGIDLSEGMYRIVKSKVDNAGLTGKVEYCVGMLPGFPMQRIVSMRYFPASRWSYSIHQKSPSYYSNAGESFVPAVDSASWRWQKEKRAI